MRSLAASSAALAVLLLGSACSGSDDPGGSPSPSSASPTGSDTASPEPTDSTGPTGSADPSAGPATDPATGATLELPHSRVRIPSDWKRMSRLVRTQQDAKDPGSASLLSLAEINAFGSTNSADELVKSVLRVTRGTYPLTPKRLPNVVVDGVEMYHLSGKIQPLRWLEEYGAIFSDRIVTLGFEFSPDVSPAERQQVVASVLATFEWR